MQRSFLKQYRIRSVCRILAWLWTLIILYLFVASQASLPGIKMKGIDDWFHFVSMLVFCFLWLCAYYTGYGKQMLLVWFLSIGFGVMVEVVQFCFTDTRGFQFKDIVYDTLGTTVGLVLFWCVVKCFYSFK